MFSNDLVSIDKNFFQLYRFLFGHIQKRSGIARQVSFKKGKYFYSAEYFWRASISLKWIKFVLSWAEYFPLEQAQSAVLSTSHLLFSRSPLTPRQEESLDKSPVTLDDGASVTMRADAQFEHAANLSQNPCNLYQCMLSLSGVWLRPIRPIMTDLSMGLLCPEPDYNHKGASSGVNTSFCKSTRPWIAGLGGRVGMLCREAALWLACSRQLGRMALVAPVCLPIHARCVGTTNIQGNLVSPIFPALRAPLFWACQPFVMVLHV